jgi:hypothetical protein
MFRAREAFRRLEGRKYDAVGLCEAFGAIRRERLSQIPPELETRDLVRLAERKGWIRTAPGGRLTVKIR